MSSPFLTIFEKDGKHWVDTGHADVGPFDTRDDAKAHIHQILDARKEHALAEMTEEERALSASKAEVQRFEEQINSDYFIELHNNTASATIYSLKQRTHHHHFAQYEHEEEGVVAFACACGVKMLYVGADEVF